MKEQYFSGSRLNATWRRLTRQIDERENPSNNFVPIRTINEHPKKEGIISTSLFGEGTDKRFWDGLVKPILDAATEIEEILPGWVIRIYISSSLPQKIFHALVSKGCELVVMSPSSKQQLYSGLLWRFLVASEDVPFLVCDADMRPNDSSNNLNDLRHVPDWLQSGKTFFRRKCFPTGMLWPICAGGWGGKPKNSGEPAIPDIKDRMEKYSHNWFGCDEAFLTKEIWPLFRKEGYYTSYSSAEKITWVVMALLVILVIIIIITRIWHRRSK